MKTPIPATPMSDSIRVPAPIAAVRLPLSTMLRLRGVHLDDDDEHGGGSDDTEGDRSTKFVDRMVAKYEDEDRKTMDDEDGITDESSDDGDEEDDRTPAPSKKGKGKAAASDDDDADAEDSDDDTPADADEDSAESDADSADDDDEEHPDDAEDDNEDSAEDSSEDDEAEGDEDDDAEVGLSDAAKAALAAKGADLTLSDVPKEVRPILTKKLKGLDAAFTKVMQESTAFRAERTQLKAEEKFRADNPAMVVVELLFKDGVFNEKLFDEVNAQIAKLEDSTIAEAFKVVVEKKRSDAVKAIESQIAAKEKWDARMNEVEGLITKQAATHGLPRWVVDQAVALVVNAAFKDHERDATNEEIQAAITGVVKQWKQEHRSETREKSKEKVKHRTQQRKTAAPATRRPASASSPGPSKGAKGKPVNWSSEESRLNRIMESTRKLAPGAR